MKLSRSCLVLMVPLCLAWACGSSSTGEDGGSGAASTGANGSGADGTGATSGSLGFGGDGLIVGGDGPISSGGTTGNGGTTGTAGSTATGGTLATDLCGGEGCICSNGKDDDGDGLVDGFDPECTGPLDNDEGSFATGIPGDNRDPKWQDCFFDGNSGAGDDHCRYATGCLTGELEQDDPDCKLTAACIKFCAPRTPNGCDCFGCCTVQLDNGDNVDIMTGTGCSLDQVNDEKACPPCTKTDQCGNTCGRCELCPGKTIEDLPEDCAPTTGTGGAGSTGEGGGPGDPGDPGYTCDGGEQVCGPNLPGCTLGAYCSLGCCIIQDPK
jgi:hypothetical protein